MNAFELSILGPALLAGLLVLATHVPWVLRYYAVESFLLILRSPRSQASA